MIRKRVYPKEPLPLSVQRLYKREVEKALAPPGPIEQAFSAPKKLLTLRMDEDIIEAFRATGKGWQARMNDALRKAMP